MSTVLPPGRGKGETKTITGQEEKKERGRGGVRESICYHVCHTACQCTDCPGGHTGNW